MDPYNKSTTSTEMTEYKVYKWQWCIKCWLITIMLKIIAIKK